MSRIPALALVSLFAFSACGGAAQTVSSPGALPQTPTAAAPVAPDRKHKKHKLVPIRITITMPHLKKHKKGHGGRYIPGTASQMVITLNKVDGNAPPSGLLATVTTQLTTTGPNPSCTINGNGTQTCSVGGPSVPVGTDNISFVAENNAPSPVALSQVTKNFNVVAGTANSFSATLLGIPANFVISTAALTAGTAVSSQSVTVQVDDPDGNEIVGTANYANPVTVTSPNAAATLSIDGTTYGSSVVLTSPAAAVTMAYTGLSTPSFSLSASASGTPTETGLVGVTNFAPVAVCSDAGANVCATGPTSNPQVNLYDVSPNTGSTANLTVTQAGWTGSPWRNDVGESDNCGAIGAAIATVAQTGSTSPGGAGTVFSVTTFGSPGGGASCIATFTGGDAADVPLAVTITYTVSGISVNGRHHDAKSKPMRR